MLGIFDLQDLLGTELFDGDLMIAGIVMYIAALLVVFALTRNITQTLIVSLPVTLIFSLMGVLSTDLMILLIIVTVLGLAFTARGIWRD